MAEPEENFAETTAPPKGEDVKAPEIRGGDESKEFEVTKEESDDELFREERPPVNDQEMLLDHPLAKVEEQIPEDAHVIEPEGTDGEAVIKSPLQTTEVKEVNDLAVSVVEFDKQQPSKMDPFAAYKVVTETSRSVSFQETKYEFWRRYRDFEWLREQLEIAHPTNIIPPLPGKQLLKYFEHFSYEFLEERKKGLHRFLQRIVSHPILTFDKSFIAFLTLPSHELQTVQGSSTGKGRLTSLTGLISDTSTKLRLKKPDPEFAKQLEYLESFSRHLSVLEGHTSKMFEERKDFTENAKVFPPAVKFWANTEVTLADPLKGLATAMEANISSIKQLNETVTQSMVSTLKEYQLYGESAMCALRYRNKLQLERDNLKDEREKKAKIRDDPKVKDNPQKEEKAKREYDKVSEECEAAIDKVECANNDLRADYEHWIGDKKHGLVDLMIDFSDKHLEYHQKCSDIWIDLMKKLNDPNSFTVKKVFTDETTASEDMSHTASREQ